MKKWILLALLVLVSFSLLFAGGQQEADSQESVTEEEAVVTADTLPRNQTLYFNGLAWGSINGWNPLSDDMNNGLAFSRQSYGSRCQMYETLYMFNFLDGGMVPFLADGEPQWNSDLTEVTVKIKDAAKWSDGNTCNSC